MKNKELFYKLMVEQGDTEATILLYGYIGESYDWDDEKGWHRSGVTDSEFVKELRKLETDGVKTLNLRINSAGGDFFHGNAIMTAIQSSPMEIHTWNDGICASMAADIWLCGKYRHMAKNALLMIHPAWSYCVGNAMDMRDTADSLDKMTEAAIIATAASIGITPDEMKAKYYATGKDVWLNHNDATTDGLITNNEDDYTSEDIPEASGDALTLKSAIQHFEKKKEGPGLMKSIKEKIETNLRKYSAEKVHHQPSHINMNLDEFKKHLADGTLAEADVRKALEEIAPPPAAPQTDATQALLTSLQETVKALTEKVEKFGAEPGAGKSNPPMPGADPANPVSTADTLKQQLDAANKELAAAAANGTNPHIGAKG